MKTALIVMTLMGCDCDAKQCEFIRTADAGWTSMQDCEKDLAREIKSGRDVAYPLITAACRPAGPSGQHLLASVSPKITVPSHIGDRPTFHAATGVPVESRVVLAKRSRFGYQTVTDTVDRAVTGTVSVASRAAGWVRQYALLGY
ncbi:hypothetical protein ATN84_05965 [Paramesorhizobium deserti]|uniref:Uncharacterized protein n=1 Tax=Paramesorhizobium deserti TaxID=1494590 RepID=A0A135I1E6_9HYPH|nr:hypothetical protein [Paramesorhizobium deserti]KXF79262.1 hypothetical protein ATN84_05965 [Paramesorhizobium deserti]